MNYGEIIAYWFLRFNGFFPLNNFVLHLPQQHPIEGERRDQNGTADTDILAIRFPHVYEEIGGQPDDWSPIFAHWGFSLDKEITAFIIEIKTGDLSENAILQEAQRAFGDNRMYAAIRRTGIFPYDESMEAMKILKKQKIYVSHDKSKRIGKLFISKEATVGRRNTEISLLLDRYAFHITLTDCEEFIVERLRKYQRRKNNDRMFFPDELIQYLAWKINTAHSGEV
ncbi:hypothetical protein [Dictyobacter kobayashii]|uniref:Uncharacterized protein n=1 Tax=Dictyobacter kobayashii TaxID=2014872 RepID=A0A402ACF9_9CHLR|nr:hypothetical protein [Dictyobacter kobayashii]GCE16775.1 hypothetical protein KDK_05750 [Dictyobacter kobayashii]